MRDSQHAHLAWPELPWAEWQQTADTLHMWTQIVGKARLALSPMENHWWNVALYVTARGLTTSPIPYRGETFDAEFDFVDHQLLVRTSWGECRAIPLVPQSVAAFFVEFSQTLGSLGIEIALHATPVEVSHPIPFAEDETHATYEREQAHRFWRVLVQVDSVFKQFRGRFLGKCSPVHFFWGSFDLAVSRFSGQPAPERPGADPITREAYSHEVISAGFWPGNGGFGKAAFYSYTAPEPAGLAEQKIGPDAAFYSGELKEFLLPYDEVRTRPEPETAILEFLESSYAAGARLAGWKRADLERGMTGGEGRRAA